MVDMDNLRFYLSIGDFMYTEERWFDTEEDLRDYVQEKTNGDTVGLNITAFEVKRFISV